MEREKIIMLNISNGFFKISDELTIYHKSTAMTEEG